MAWDEGLEGTVKEIAGTDLSPLRVLAGPGTGKSFALKRRVERLLESGINPHQILACTFTRTAAADLQRDLQNLGVEGASEITATTLHARCFALLRRQQVLAITGRVTRTLMEFETDFVLADLAGQEFGGKREKQRRLQAFNAAWARMQSEQPGWPTARVDRAFHHALMDWLIFHRAMLVGELVPLALRYLRDNPESQELRRFTHVLVDEYQDLNLAEQTVADLLSTDTHLAVVGDEDQSIYSFKYAHPEGIRDFHLTRPNTFDLTLEVCRRCPTSVVTIANSLIDHNPDRQNRTLQPHRENGEGEIRVVQWRSLNAEVAGLVEYIVGKIADGSFDPGKILVLTPSRQIGYAIRDQLSEAGTSAVSYFTEQATRGNPAHLHECDNQQALTLLRLIADPNDRVALRCWCGFGSNSRNSRAWRSLINICGEANLEPSEALELALNGDLTIPYGRPILERFRLLQDERLQLEGLTGPSLLDALFPEDVDWAIPFRELAMEHSEDGEEEDEYDAATLDQILRTGLTSPEIPEEVDFVRVMSLHKSKGLTADLVVIAGCLEGLIPRAPKADNRAERDAELREQRRLFYVGITRTRRTLVLSSASTLPRATAHRMQVRVVGTNPTLGRTIASRFIHELGPSIPASERGADFLNE